MTTCLRKSCSFGLLCVSCVGVCQFVSVLWDFIVLFSNYSISLYFVPRKHLCRDKACFQFVHCVIILSSYFRRKLFQFLPLKLITLRVEGESTVRRRYSGTNTIKFHSPPSKSKEKEPHTQMINVHERHAQ